MINIGNQFYLKNSNTVQSAPTTWQQITSSINNTQISTQDIAEGTLAAGMALAATVLGMAAHKEGRNPSLKAAETEAKKVLKSIKSTPPKIKPAHIPANLKKTVKTTKKPAITKSKISETLPAEPTSPTTEIPKTNKTVKFTNTNEIKINGEHINVATEENAMEILGVKSREELAGFKSAENETLIFSKKYSPNTVALINKFKTEQKELIEALQTGKGEEETALNFAKKLHKTIREQFTKKDNQELYTANAQNFKGHFINMDEILRRKDGVCRHRSGLAQIIIEELGLGKQFQITSKSDPSGIHTLSYIKFADPTSKKLSFIRFDALYNAKPQYITSKEAINQGLITKGQALLRGLVTESDNHKKMEEMVSALYNMQNSKQIAHAFKGDGLHENIRDTVIAYKRMDLLNHALKHGYINETTKQDLIKALKTAHPSLQAPKACVFDKRNLHFEQYLESIDKNLTNEQRQALLEEISSGI